MRADKFFAGRFGSRTKAAEALEKGLISRNGKLLRPKDEIDSDEGIAIREAEERYVSNGGYKLARALREFSFDCGGKIFADIGASTGGFTDCLLQHGARKVYAIDVGESLLHPSLKKNVNVISLEKINARYLTNENFSDTIEGVTADVSFISLRLILPVVKSLLAPDGTAFVLVKPQFECERRNIGKSGIVRTAEHPKIVGKVLSYCAESGLYPFGIVNAPVRKGKNLEYVLYLKNTYTGAASQAEILRTTRELLERYARGILE